MLYNQVLLPLVERCLRLGILVDAGHFVDYIHLISRARSDRLDRAERRRLWWVEIAHWIGCFHFFGWSLAKPDSSSPLQLILHNFVYLESLPNAFNALLPLPSCLLASRLFRLLTYCGPTDRDRLPAVWIQMFQGGDGRKSGHERKNQRKLFSPKSRLNMSWSVVVGNFWRLNLYAMALVYHFTYDLRSIPTVFTYNKVGYLHLTTHLLVCVAVNVVAWPLMQSLGWFATLGTLTGVWAHHDLTAAAIYVRRRLLKPWTTSGGKLNGRRFAVFQADTDARLRMLRTVSTLFGAGLLWFVVCSMPSTAALWSVVWFGALPAHLRMLGIAVGLYSMTILFLLHLSICRLARGYHRPARMLLPVAVGWLGTNSRRCRRPQLRVQLRLAAFLCQFHTIRPYSVTYGRRLGAITYGSLGTCVVTYWKLLVFVFKLW